MSVSLHLYIRIRTGEISGQNRYMDCANLNYIPHIIVYTINFINKIINVRSTLYTIYSVCCPQGFLLFQKARESLFQDTNLR